MSRECFSCYGSGVIVESLDAPSAPCACLEEADERMADDTEALLEASIELVQRRKARLVEPPTDSDASLEG